MWCSTRFQRMTYFAISILVIGSIIGAAASRDGWHRFTRTSLSIDDLVSVYGLDIYKFNLDLAASQTFQLTLREQLDKDKPWKNLFSEELHINDAPNTTLLVSFTRFDGQFGRVLLTNHQEAGFSVRVCDEKRCYIGMSTNIPVPLSNADDIVLFVHESGDEISENTHRILRLFTMKPSLHAKKTGDGTFPRAELVLVRKPEEGVTMR